MVPAPAPAFSPVSYASLVNWDGDDHAAAKATYLRSIHAARLAAPIEPAGDPKEWFERHFQPTLLTQSAHLTGYYEPEVAASKTKTAHFSQPVYALPDPGFRDFSRAEIDKGSLSRNCGVIAWVSEPIDVFMMQLQGCGRLRFASNDLCRIGFAGSNGHPYRSLGQEMIRRGLIEKKAVTAHSIRSYVLENPRAGLALLWHNPSYAYFRELNHLLAEDGPVGSLGISLAAVRSLAIDPAHVPLGYPVWVSTEGPTLSLHQLFVAQDIGGAIKGKDRADLFLGNGGAAGDVAGRLNQLGTLVTLRPKIPR